MKKTALHIVFISLFFAIPLKSQTKISDNLHLGIEYHRGFLLPEYGLFNYFTNNGINGIKAGLTKDLKGDKLWERVYNYPSTGISVYYGTLGNDSIFGKVFSVFPNFSLPLFRFKNLTVFSQTGLGCAYTNKKFDLESNYQNIAIGSGFNIWFSETVGFRLNLNEKISLTGGSSFGHFSNGNLSEPNLGLNFWTFYLGTNYLLTKETEKNTDKIPPFKRKNEFAFVIAGGAKHTRRFAEKVYFAGSVSAEAKRVFYYKFSAGAGADFFYDASIPDEMERAEITDVKDIYKIKTGIHLSQELIVGKLSLIVQEGVYIGLTDKLNNQKMYNRGIVRYKITDNFFVNLAMKTNLWILDVAELGAGYYFGNNR